MPSFLRCVHRLEQQPWPSTAPRSAATVCSVNRGHEAIWCVYIDIYFLCIYLFILNLNRVSGPQFVFFVISTCGLGGHKWFWCAGGCFSTDMSLYIYIYIILLLVPCYFRSSVLTALRGDAYALQSLDSFQWLGSICLFQGPQLLPGKKRGLATFQAGLTSSVYIYI